MDVEISFGTKAAWLRFSPLSHFPFIMDSAVYSSSLSSSELVAKYLTHLASVLTTIHLKAVKTIKKIKEPEEDADKRAQ